MWLFLSIWIVHTGKNMRLSKSCSPTLPLIAQEHSRCTCGLSFQTLSNWFDFSFPKAGHYFAVYFCWVKCSWPTKLTSKAYIQQRKSKKQSFNKQLGILGGGGKKKLVRFVLTHLESSHWQVYQQWKGSQRRPGSVASLRKDWLPEKVGKKLFNTIHYLFW